MESIRGPFEHSKVINFKHFAQTSTIAKSCLSKSKFDSFIVQASQLKVHDSQPLSVTPFCIYDFINLILSSPILTLFLCHSFLILFYLRNSRTDVFVSDTHYLLTFIQFLVAYLGGLFVNGGFKLSVILPFMIAEEEQLCKC